MTTTKSKNNKTARKTKKANTKLSKAINAAPVISLNEEGITGEPMTNLHKATQEQLDKCLVNIKNYESSSGYTPDTSSYAAYAMFLVTEDDALKKALESDQNLLAKHDLKASFAPKKDDRPVIIKSWPEVEALTRKAVKEGHLVERDKQGNVKCWNKIIVLAFGKTIDLILDTSDTLTQQNLDLLDPTLINVRPFNEQEIPVLNIPGPGWDASMKKKS